MMYKSSANGPQSRAVISLFSLCCLIASGLSQAATIEEIVVTAQKREQNLQDVPISVQAIGSEMLDDRNITSFENMELPGVHIGQGGADDNVYIRGVGSTGARGFDQSVPLYHDGVYLSRARQQRVAFLDVERIEVLKGPQPTYLGKNAIGGAISIISRRPTDEFEGTVELNSEFEHEETTAFLALSGPLSETFRARAAFKYRDIDGWVRNVATGRSGPAEEDTLFRLSAEWDVTESFSLYFKYDFADIKENESANQKSQCAANDFIDPALDSCTLDDLRAVLFDEAGFPFARDAGVIPSFAASGDASISFIDNEAFQIIADWSIGEYQLTSSTSYYEFENKTFSKNDLSTIQLSIGSLPETVEQFSQELRLLSPRGEKVDWLLGVYLDDLDREIQTNAVVNAAAAFGILGPQIALTSGQTRQSDSWAVFGEAGFDLSDAWRATVGFRYSDVQQDGVNTTDAFFVTPGGLVPFAPFTFTEPASSDDSDFQPSVTLEWRPSEQAMWYLSWKEGFKSGGPNIRPLPTNPTLVYGPEEVTAFELGAKITLADGAATLNFAVFQSEFTDLQVTSLDPQTLSFITQNAAAATTQGIEVDAAWAASDQVTLHANLTLLDAEYDSFAGVACFDLPVQTLAEGCDPVTGTQDLSGTTLLYSPDLSGNLAIEWVMPLSSSALEISTRLDWFYTDKFQTGAKNDPDTFQDSYSKLDLRVAIGPADGPWSLAAIGRNLSDEVTTHFYGDTGGGGGLSQQTLLDRPRQISLQFRYDF